MKFLLQSPEPVQTPVQALAPPGSRPANSGLSLQFEPRDEFSSKGNISRHLDHAFGDQIRKRN